MCIYFDTLYTACTKQMRKSGEAGSGKCAALQGGAWLFGPHTVTTAVDVRHAGLDGENLSIHMTTSTRNFPQITV